MSRSGIRMFNSLETRLPVVIGGLVAILLLGSLAATYYELRSSAVQTATERLSRVSRQLAELLESSSAGRAQQLTEAASDARLVSLLRGRDDDDAAAHVHAVLERLRQRSDGIMPIQLRTTDGTVVAGIGAPGAFAETPGGFVPPATRGVSYGDLYEEAGEARYWVSVPVYHDSELLGFIVQQRRFGSRGYGEQIEQLIGSSIEIYFTSPAGGTWVSVEGDIMPRSMPVPAIESSFLYTGSTGSEYSAFATPLQSNWLLVAAMPLDQTLSRAYHVMRRLLGFGLLLMLGGGIAAWLVSRTVTAPLQRLSAAADAIAAGDYTRRTGVDRSDEIGRLARSFDSMTRQVELSHEQLDHRLREARTLAAELEGANMRLQQALLEVEAARGEAQEASRAKSEFLATVSHEIRTPINAIVGYTDLMELGLGGTLSLQHADYVERIRRSGAHLTALINDVLDFAKIESGQMRVAREVRSAPAVIHEAVSMLQPRIDERQIRLEVRTALEVVYLGDAQRVQQILINLLANALKFTDEGGSVVISTDRRVSHSPSPEPGDRTLHEWTCITVADSGIGIPADHFERIFQPFVQGASGYTRPHGGAGLGLAISRSLARMMGGDLSVESAPGSGSSFTLWLPYPSPLHAATVATTVEGNPPAAAR